MIPDPIVAGLARGWKHIDGAALDAPLNLEADVVIVGTGAGGGTAAEILTQAGLEVVLVEAGPLRSSTHFVMEERRAYPDLYQQSAAMKTRDGAIGMLQGRSVGGSTTVNWTTSIRTPKPTLAHWARHHRVEGLSRAELDPWFERAERRLNIHPWPVPPNRNNDTLAQGCAALGWEYTVIRRNVKGCANLGYCGMGCPINAKQSMLVTTLPAALDAGATLLSRTEAWTLSREGERITALNCLTRDPNHQRREVGVTVRARHYLLCGGALHSPALMLRSALPDPHQRVGQRTFLHPSVMSVAEFDGPVAAHAGAPQSVYSDQFVWPEEGLGFKLEVAPLHPVLVATNVPGFGPQHQALMQRFNHIQGMIALVRDGFDATSPGGRVQLDDHGDPLLDYPLNDAFWQAARRAFLAMAEAQFAAGAQRVMTMDDSMPWWASWAEAKAGIPQLELAPLKTMVASAHIMGGCGMSEDPTQGVVDSLGRHHQLANLSVMDGSMLPTSLGANPQLTLYGIVGRNATALAERLGS
ncbi:GMC family oxidoreductase [Ferrimonas balearica]|uniref:GMC family oxidoreductase n=1 Tax=Ferrimonas balearica TaxID=44012 RepID=UPI001C9A2272|nr:GMC family oxidoreductase [Ferrimonas balearica]MBY5993054.1 GMC family oxidoreductase [Ferrimonas balearica]